MCVTSVTLVIMWCRWPVHWWWRGRLLWQVITDSSSQVWRHLTTVAELAGRTQAQWVIPQRVTTSGLVHIHQLSTNTG